MTDREALREQIHKLQSDLEQLDGKAEASAGLDRRKIQLQAAEISEQIYDLREELKSATPRHRVSYKRETGKRGGGGQSQMDTPWDQAAVEQWDPWGDKSWASARETGVLWQSDRQLMIMALQEAKTGAPLTDKQRAYASAAEHMPQKEIARMSGVNKASVSRTLSRGMDKTARDARVRFSLSKAKAGYGNAKNTAQLLAELLTPTQLLYIYLYYGEWMTLREIGRLLDRDQGTVQRTIRRALERLDRYLVVGLQIDVSGLETLLIDLYDASILEHTEEARCVIRHRRATARAPSVNRLAPASALLFIRSKSLQISGTGSGRLVARLHELLASVGALAKMRVVLVGLVQRFHDLYKTTRRRASRKEMMLDGH